MKTTLPKNQIKFGVKLNRRLLDNNYERMKRIAIEADKLGYHSIWNYDHLMLGNYPQFEPLTILTALSSVTKKIRFGTTVLNNSLRYPSILAKIGTTLDVISNGRYELGIGAGWDEREYIAYGIPYYKPAIRIGMLREAVQIIKKLWTEEKATFNGKYYTIKDAVCEPKPIQKPHPPIWIGGSGEKLTLKVVAKYANGYNTAWGTPEETKHKFDVLERHCIKIGRDTNEIVKSWQGNCIIADTEREVKEEHKKLQSRLGIHAREMEKNPRLMGTPEQIIEIINKYINVGVTLFIVGFPNMTINDVAPLRLFRNEVYPTFKT